MTTPKRPWWQQATALVSLSAGGAVTGFAFAPKAAAADIESPSNVNIRLLALTQAAKPPPADDSTLRTAIVNVASYYLRMAESKTPAEMEQLIWQHDSLDGVDHGESCAAFASLTLELAAQVVGQQSWVSGGGSYPWPLHTWVDPRVDPNPSSPQIISVLQDAQAHDRWHPLGDGYRPLPGDWVLFDEHVEVVTKYANGVLDTIGGDSLPNLSVNAHQYAGSLADDGVVGFVNNGNLAAAPKAHAPTGPGSGPGTATQPRPGPGQKGQTGSGPSHGGRGGGPPGDRTPAGGSQRAGRQHPGRQHPGRQHAGGQHAGRPGDGGPGDGGPAKAGQAEGQQSQAAIPGVPASPSAANLPRAAARARRTAPDTATAPATTAAIPGVPAVTPADEQRPQARRRSASQAGPRDEHQGGRSQASHHDPASHEAPADSAARPSTLGWSQIPGVPATVETAVAKPTRAAANPRPRATAPAAPATPAAAAPTGTERTFIEQIAPGAMAAQRRYGVPAAVTIAQAILESGWGTSTLAARDHNLFGIKGTGPAGGVLYPTTEYVNGRPVARTAEFRVYHDVAQSIDDHGRLIADSGYYGQAMASRHDPNAFANALTGVYATDPDYGTKLIGMMQQYHLYRFDGTGAATPHAASGAPTSGSAGQGGPPAGGSGPAGPATPVSATPASGQVSTASIPGLPLTVPPARPAPVAAPRKRPEPVATPRKRPEPVATPRKRPAPVSSPPSTPAPRRTPPVTTSPAPTTTPTTGTPQPSTAPTRTAPARPAPSSSQSLRRAPEAAPTARPDAYVRPAPATRAARKAAPAVDAVSVRRLRPSAEYRPPSRASGSSRTGRARHRDDMPPAVHNAFNLMAKAPLMAKKTLYQDVASQTGVGWQLLAACDWMQCKAQARYSPVHGEKLGTANPDGTMYRTKSEALDQCADDLVELAWEVYEIDLPGQDHLSVCELANVFAAFRWGELLRLHHTSAMEFPYSVAGLTEAHLHMRWPNIDDPNTPDKPGARFRMPFGAVPVVLNLNYPAVD